jgi:hypothetical protein
VEEKVLLGDKPPGFYHARQASEVLAYGCRLKVAAGGNEFDDARVYQGADFEN